MGRYNTFQKGDNPNKISPPDHHLLSFNYKSIRQIIINFCKNVFTLFYSAWTIFYLSLTTIRIDTYHQLSIEKIFLF